MEYFAKNYDVIVIGGGHAGIEAGLAAARLGCVALIVAGILGLKLTSSAG